MAGHDSAARYLADSKAPAEPSSAGFSVPPFESIYQQYFDFVWSSTVRLGVKPAAIDDVVQEIFMVIHSRLATLREPASLRSWIYGIVRRTVSAHHRSQRTRSALGDTFALETELQQPIVQTPLELTEQHDQLKLLQSLLDAIEPVKREVFVLAELEQMTVPEIAEALEIPLNTAYSRLRAAREAFEHGLARRAARREGRG
jgi:RNA polymerase sigma-70 factor (ECF subfamily)